ncbi:MAG: hypothetical protein ACI9O6_001183 [Glaciecola sp.]|jgi:hypothetical protein
MLKIMSLLSLCLVFQTALHAKTCDSLESLTWFLGNWQSESKELQINESWKRVSSNTFEGSAYTFSIEKNAIVSSETLRLVEMSGEVFYVVKVASNDLPVAFKLTTCTAETAVFENSLHDFPQKLSYHINKEGNVTVFVSGEKGKRFSIEYIAGNDS